MVANYAGSGVFPFPYSTFAMLSHPAMLFAQELSLDQIKTKLSVEGFLSSFWTHRKLHSDHHHHLSAIMPSTVMTSLSVGRRASSPLLSARDFAYAPPTSAQTASSSFVDASEEPLVNDAASDWIPTDARPTLGSRERDGSISPARVRRVSSVTSVEETPLLVT